MPRYMVERTFADGLQIPADAQGAKRTFRNLGSG